METSYKYKGTHQFEIHSMVHTAANLYSCTEYPQYTFKRMGKKSMDFRVSMVRNVDATLMIELLVGEMITLTPSRSMLQFDRGDAKTITNAHDVVANVYTKREHVLNEMETHVYRIMNIDQSANGRRLFITLKQA